MLPNEPFVYFGTSAFSADILRGLLATGLIPSVVVTTVAKPAGRGLKTVPTPVAAVAQPKNLPLIEVATLKSADVQTQLASCATKFAILAAFGKIIPPAVLNLYPKGIINVHPSLLPLYRGPAPIQSVICDGQNETGVSLIVLDNEVDHGPILAQEKLPISDSDDAATLSQKLASLATNILPAVLTKYLSSAVSPTPQDHQRATFTKMIKREDGKADFSKTAAELDRQRRAYAPWPGLWTVWQSKRLKLVQTTVSAEDGQKPGVVSFTNQQLAVACGQGSLLIQKLQLEGSAVLDAAEFLRGHRNFVGSQLPS